MAMHLSPLTGRHSASCQTDTTYTCLPSTLQTIWRAHLFPPCFYKASYHGFGCTWAAFDRINNLTIKKPCKKEGLSQQVALSAPFCSRAAESDVDQQWQWPDQRSHISLAMYLVLSPAANIPPGVDPEAFSWFQSVDTDHSGHISVKELRQALVNSNWSAFSDETCLMMMSEWQIWSDVLTDVWGPYNHFKILWVFCTWL